MFSRRAFLALLPAPFVARFLPTKAIAAAPIVDAGIYRYTYTVSFVTAAGETVPDRVDLPCVEEATA